LAYLAAECVGGGLAANHRPLLALLEQIRATTDVPMIGSGGVTTGRGAAAVLGAGAIAAQLGTALLCTPEAGTSALYRQALLDARFPDTILTRAYSGRFPRGLANRFALEHDGQAPQAYPEVHHLTRPLRAAATKAGDASVPNLWAGTGWLQETADRPPRSSAASPQKPGEPALTPRAHAAGWGSATATRTQRSAGDLHISKVGSDLLCLR